MADRGRIPAALAIAAVCAIAQVPVAAASSCPGAETEAEGQSTAELEQSVLCLINQRRDAAGVGRLKTSAQLAEAAAKHSSDMVEKGYFDHTSPTGSTFIDRISATGYMRSARSWLVGENLVWGSGERSTPGSLVEAWMESPPHRANLLRGRFREIGLAGARGTPEGARSGITVTSEYGYRDLKKKKRTRKSGRKTGRRGQARKRSWSKRS